MKIPKNVLEDQIERVQWMNILFPSIKGKVKERPGEIIQKLSQEDRTALKELKSDDIKDIRWPRELR